MPATPTPRRTSTQQRPYDGTPRHTAASRRRAAQVAASPAAPSDGKLLLTVDEAARRLGIGRTVMYRLVSSGAVGSVTIGRLRRIPCECLSEYVSALRSGQGEDSRATGSAA